jgi:hypothetical protein
MGVVGSNGFFVFLLFFHALIGMFGVYRMRVRKTVENPDSQFVAMPSTITPAGIELNPTTEPIEEPRFVMETSSVNETIPISEPIENKESVTEPTDENKNN